MKSSTSWLRLAAIVTYAAAAGCSDNGATGPTQPLAVQLEQQRLVLDAGASARLKLVSSNGALPQLTTASWSSSNPAVATVNQAGEVVGVSPGEAVVSGVITYKLSRATVSAEVVVTATPARLQMRSGEGQAGRVGSVLPVPVQVEVTDGAGRPVAGATVSFTASGPNQAVYLTTSARTDAQGTCTTSWTLGTQAGKHTLVAALAGGSAQPLSIQASAQAAEATSFTLQSGAGQTGIVGAPLATVLRVRMLDPFGNGVPGAAVSWEAEAESGAFDSFESVTDTAGFASAVWLLGPRVGQQAANVASNLGSIHFTATSIAPYATRVEVTGAAAALGSRGATLQLSGSAYDHTGAPITGMALMWWSLHPQIATVNQSGIVTARSDGTTEIYASADGTAGKYVVTVRQQVAQVNVEPATVSMEGPGTFTRLTQVAVDSLGNSVPSSQVVWSTSEPTVATVDAEGRVQALGTGTAEITAVVNGKPGKSKVFVGKPAPPSVTAVVVTPELDSIPAIGRSIQLSAVTLIGQQVVTGTAITWQSLDPDVAGVSPAGKVTAVSNGTARIVAAADGHGDTATVVVRQKVTRVTLTPATASIAPGASRTLDAKALDANGFAVAEATLAWSSSAVAIARVDGNGKVLALAPGTAQISASNAGISAGSTITVTGVTAPVPADLSITLASGLLAVGDTVLATALVRDASGNVIVGAAVSWSSSNPTVAQVSSSGLIRVMAAGTAIITATAGAARGTVEITATTAPSVAVAAVIVSPQADTITALGASEQFTAVGRDAQGNSVPGASISWTSLNAGIATVSEVGNVTAKSIGTALIVAAATGCSSCVADTVSTVVIQKAASIELSAPNVAMPPGGSVQLTATVRDAGGSPLSNPPLVWSSDNAAVVQITTSGLVTAVAAGTATISASSGGVSAQSVVTVQSAPLGQPTDIPLALHRLDGKTGTVRVSTGILLRPGQLSESGVASTSILVGGTEVSAYVEALKGRHKDGSVVSLLVQFDANPATQPQATLRLGTPPTKARLAKTVVDFRPGATPATLTTNGYPAAIALPSVEQMSAAFALFGPTVTVAEAQALGGSYAAFESDFVSWSQKKWEGYPTVVATAHSTTDGIILANYYDRGFHHFAWAHRSGNPEYFRRGAAYIFNNRRFYYEPNAYKAQPHLWMFEGLAAHYWLTGDEESRRGVHEIAKVVRATYWTNWKYLNWAGESRPMARSTMAVTWAHRLGFTDVAWDALAREAVDKLLTTEVYIKDASDYRYGAWTYRHPNADPSVTYVANFMNAMILDALITIYEHVHADPRIPGMVQRNLDYLRKSQWRGPEGNGLQITKGEPSPSFNYFDVLLTGSGGPNAAVDLNGFFVNPFAWYGHHSGDASYTNMAQKIFDTLANPAKDGRSAPYLTGEKQFNETYQKAWQMAGYRR